MVLDELKRLVAQSIDAVGQLVPRIVQFGRRETPVVIFVDGACEVEATSVGEVLLDQGGRPELSGATSSEPRKLENEGRPVPGDRAG